MPGRAARACGVQGAYKEALAAYTRALRAHPGAPAEVRLGLAACHFRLGRLPAARAAFQRTLDLAPGCAEALLGLAVIAFAGPNPERCANGSWAQGLSLCLQRVHGQIDVGSGKDDGGVRAATGLAQGLGGPGAVGSM